MDVGVGVVTGAEVGVTGAEVAAGLGADVAAGAAEVGVGACEPLLVGLSLVTSACTCACVSA